MMQRPVKVTFLSLVLALFPGCGARTGLLFEEERDGGSDAAPDVFGDYPCNYSYTGELAPVLPEHDHAFRPRLLWAEERLAVSFWTDAIRPFIGICTTTLDEGLECAEYFEAGENAMWLGDVAWNGSGMGVCFGGEDSGGSGQIGMLFRETSPLGEPLAEVRVIEPHFVGNCHEIVWVEDHYLSYWEELTDALPTRARVIESDRNGRLLGSAIPDLFPTSALAVALEADGPVAALAWAGPEGLGVRVLEGLPSLEVPLSTAVTERVGMGLRGPIAAVVWVENLGRTSDLHMVLVDLSRGVVGEPLELRSLEGSISGLDVIGVYEGFLISWVEHEGGGSVGRLMVNPTRVHDGLEIEQRWTLELHEGNIGEWGGFAGPSLAYDGNDAYVGVVIIDDEDFSPRVHVQRLACHR